MNVNKSWLCVKNVNISLFYVGPILQDISYLANGNVLIRNYAGVQVIIFLKIEEVIKILFMYGLILLLSTLLITTRLVY